MSMQIAEIIVEIAVALVIAVAMLRTVG